MIDLVVIADDFTGSLDTGVQFSKAGAKVVATARDHLSDIDTEGVQVLVVNTESRHLPAREAREIVSQVVTEARKLDPRHFYKKTDSTLRGNVGAELDAFLSATGRKAVVFVPAFPRAGRTTVRGNQLVDGVPLQETEFAADPIDPVSTSHVPSLIAAQTKVPVVLAAEHWRPADQPSIIVFDAKTDEDLVRIGSYIKADMDSLAFAGCAGFATVLASLIQSNYWQRETPLLSRRGGTLVICGSMNPTSIAQIRRAQKDGISVVSATSAIASSFSADRPSGEKVYDRLVSAIRERNVAVLSTTLTQGRERKSGRLSFVAYLGGIVARCVEEEIVDALVVLGGDTLRAVMDSLGVTGVEPIDEIMPGAPVSVPVYRERPHSEARILVVSKAGGFGDDDFVARALGYIERVRTRK